MKWLIFFGSLEGRIGRKSFWLLSIAVTAVEFLAVLGAVSIVVAFSIDDWWIEIIIIAFLYPQFVIHVKRGHDRNIPLWVIGAFYGVVATRIVLIHLGWLVRLPTENVTSLTNVLSFVMTILLAIAGLALLIELGFRRGKRGPNHYGPDPLMKA